MIILETQRLFLREMNMNDYYALYAVLADREIMQHYPYIFDEERVKSWIERNMNRYRENGFGLWAVCLKETGEMVGDCGLTLQNIDGKMPELSFIPVNMHLLPNSMKIMVLNCHKELFACIASKFRDD